MKCFWLSLLLIALASCADTDPSGKATTGPRPDPIPVLDPLGLSPVPYDEDPFPEHRSPYDICPPAAWGEEYGSFEIQTGVCQFAAFDQELPVELTRGDELYILIWHDFLDAAEPATGHVVVWIEDTIVWETTVQIPAESATIEAIVPIEFHPSTDARLGIHLHNHGYNSWRFVLIDVHPR